MFLQVITDEASVAASAPFSLVVDRNPETGRTGVAGCGGDLFVVPTSDALEPVTLAGGEAVTVTVATVGDVISLDQSYLPIITR